MVWEPDMLGQMLCGGVQPQQANARYPNAHHLYDLIEGQSALHSEAAAITAPGRAPLSYAGLRRQVDEVLGTLRAMGIGRGDRVAIVLPNGAEMAVAFIAVTACAISAPLEPVSRLEEVDYYFSSIGVKAVVVMAGSDGPARAIAQAHGIPVIELAPVPRAAAGTFTLTGAGHLSAAAAEPRRSDDLAVVLHTSGTASRPKLVPLTHANLCNSARDIARSCELVESDRCLNILPLIHGHGLMSSICATLMAGSSVVCAPGFDADMFFACMREFRPTWYTAVPAIHQAILGAASRNRETIAMCPLRLIRSASTRLPARVMAELESVFAAPVVEFYGMTEACSQITSNLLPPRVRKTGSVGMPTGSEVAIIDDAGVALPTGEIGEIAVRGVNVVRCYDNASEADERAFVRGWLRTGDQGYLDDDGYLFLTGRLKAIINRGGKKVLPYEVDEALLQHPEIVDAVAFARPHPTLGEDLVAAVVVRPEATVTESEIRIFLLQRLAEYKVPSQVVTVDEVPRNATRKVQRIGLYRTLAQQLKTEFVSPENSMENALARIWGKVLGVSQVGVNSNFFDLGGNSLMLMEVQGEIAKVIGRDVPAIELFAHSTVRALARHLSAVEFMPGMAEWDPNPTEKLRDGNARLLQQRVRRQNIAASSQDKSR
jgi:oxalate---CoA ligase